MAMGLPVLASNFPLYKEIVEQHQCGLTVDPENQREIIEALRFLLESPDTSFEMGQRGRQAVLKNYNWTTELEKLEKLYQSMMKKRTIKN